MKAADFLELSFTLGIQRSFIKQVQIPRVLVSSVLFSGFFDTSKALQQSGFQGSYVSMKRLCGLSNLEEEGVQVI